MISKKELQKLAIELFDIGAFSTRTSKTTVYIDLKELLAHPNLLARLSMMLWSLADLSEKHDRICGVPCIGLSRCGISYCAITYAYQISTQTKIPMLMQHRSVNTSSNVIKGQFEIGDRVFIVDDEISNGNNILEIAIDLLKEKMKIGEALVVIDREQGGDENLENAGIKVKSLFRISELIRYLRDAGKISAYGQTTEKDNNNVIQFVKDIPTNVKDRNTRKRGFV